MQIPDIKKQLTVQGIVRYRCKIQIKLCINIFKRSSVQSFSSFHVMFPKKYCNKIREKVYDSSLNIPRISH